MFEIKKMRQEFQMNTNPPNYLPHYTPQSGNRSSILKDLSEIPDVILFNICTDNIPTYLHASFACLLFGCPRAIEHENCVVVHRRAFNTSDD